MEEKLKQIEALCYLHMNSELFQDVQNIFPIDFLDQTFQLLLKEQKMKEKKKFKLKRKKTVKLNDSTKEKANEVKKEEEILDADRDDTPVIPTLTEEKDSKGKVDQYDMLTEKVSEEIRNSDLPHDGPYLLFLGNVEQKYFYLNSNTCTIGRSPNLELTLNCEAVSKRHACIFKEKDGYIIINHFRFWLLDLMSTNGTFVNAERIYGSRILNDGDLIQIGTISFIFKSQ